MECNTDDLPINHTVLEGKNEAKEKPLSACRRRRRTLSLTSQLSNIIISSDREDMNSCQMNVKLEESGSNLACERDDGSSSSQAISEGVIKCEESLPGRILRSSTQVKNKQNQTVGFNEESRKWTEAEKLQLIHILKNEGYDGDIQKLANRFPRQTVDSLRYLLVTMVSPNKEEWEMKLDNYIKIVKHDYGGLNLVENCPQFVDCYSKFGKHPCPSEVGGVDYQLIYQSIAYFMHGGIPKILDERSRTKLCLLVQKLRKHPRDRRKYSISEDDMPPKKDTRTREDRNEDLAERRRKHWSEGDKAARTNALSKDIDVVHKFFVSYDCFNSFKFPLD